MKRTSLRKTCLLLMLCEGLSICLAQNTYTVNAEVGQVVTIPCGVQVNGNWTRLVWKLEDVSNSQELAYSYAGSVLCDKSKKDCSLTQDGSLVIRNVKISDGGDYFCVLDVEQKYYSRHTLIINPAVLLPAFYTCPTLEDVFVTQTGHQEMVLAYTSPVCGNTDVVGNVTCDPPSGVKIGMNFEEIVCNCTHSGNQVDTCEIPIPDVPPAFENCPGSDSVSISRSDDPSSILVSYTIPVCKNPKNVTSLVSCDPPSGTMTDATKIICKCIALGNTVDTCEIPIPSVSVASAPVNGLGFFICIVLGAVLGGVLGVVLMFLYEKHNSKQSLDIEKIPESQALMNNTGEKNRVPPGSGKEIEEHTKPQFTTRLQPQMTAIQGELLELTCSVNGHPTPTILWYKDGKHLDPQVGYNKTFLDGVAKLTSPSIKGSDEGMYFCIVVNPAGDDITSCNVVVKETITVPPSDENGTPVKPAQKREESVNNQGSSPGFGSQVQSPDVGMLESGQPLASVTETDGSMQGAVKDSHRIPQFGGMKELVVESDTPKFRILPSVAKPSDGVEIVPAESQFGSYLDFYLHDKDGVPIPNITFEQQTHGLSTNVAELVTLPVHITCGKCGESCCLLEVYGDDYSDMKEKSYCKKKCAKDGQNEI